MWRFFRNYKIISSAFISEVTVTPFDPTILENIKQYSCYNKSGSRQVVVSLMSHGSKEGKISDSDSNLLTHLESICEAIKENNRQAADDDNKIKRVKINVVTCHGDAVVSKGALQKVIRLFVDAGIDVVTSALAPNLIGRGHALNGKNPPNADSNKTTIIERLYTATEIDADQMEKYPKSEVWDHPTGACYSREKIFLDNKRFLVDEYVGKAEKKTQPGSAPEANTQPQSSAKLATALGPRGIYTPSSGR